MDMLTLRTRVLQTLWRLGERSKDPTIRRAAPFLYRNVAAGACYSVGADFAPAIGDLAPDAWADMRKPGTVWGEEWMPPDAPLLLQYQDGPQAFLFDKRPDVGFDVFNVAPDEPVPLKYFGVIAPCTATLSRTVFAPSEAVQAQTLTLARSIAADVVKCLCIFNLIRQPTFTRSVQMGTRHQRRVAQRSGKANPDKWRRIEWNVGEEVKRAVTASGDASRRMPMHYTRGHWRRAEEGWKNTTQRADGNWYQWIDGFWSGHPAFGIIRSVHAPKLGKSAAKAAG